VLPPSFGPNTGGTKFAVFSSITCDEPELRMMDDEKEEEE
jgi:hypothetical protein